MTAPDGGSGIGGGAPGLTEAQLDGLACIHCGRRPGVKVPVGFGPRGQLFACESGCPDRIADDVHGPEGGAA